MDKLNELKDLSNEIDEEIYSIETNDVKLQAMPDGIINVEMYFKEQLKIMWILKEPYDGFEDDKPSDGGFSIREVLNLKENGEQFGGEKRTYFPIIHTSYGILNNFTLWNDMPNADKSLDVFNALKSIAYINVKKIPGYKKSSAAIIGAAYIENKDLLFKQIETYKPNIIIGGYTLHYFFKDLGIEIDKLEKFGSIRYYSTNDTLYIDAYHPSQWSIASKENYSNDIILVAKKWYESKFLK